MSKQSRLNLLVSMTIALAIVAWLPGCDDASAPGGGGIFGDGTSGPGEPAKPSLRKPLDVVSNSIGMKLVVVPPGKFQMGSPLTEEKRSGEEVLHDVEITKPFFMGAFEVTQDEFEIVMSENPSGVKDNGKLPVHNVSWEQAVAFCRKLSERPAEKAAGRTYRLPTEAEWEYACRATTTTATAFGDALTSEQANLDGTSPYGEAESGAYLMKPATVGSYKANGFGLYDMHGNVWEYCSDWYVFDYYSNSPEEDPQGPDPAFSHVIRGGSWYEEARYCRSAYRTEYVPPLDSNYYGFRVVASMGVDSFDSSASVDLASAPPIKPESMEPAPTDDTDDSGTDDDDESDAGSTPATTTSNPGANTLPAGWRKFLPLALIVPALAFVLCAIDYGKLGSWHHLDLLLLCGVFAMQLTHEFNSATGELIGWLVGFALIARISAAPRFNVDTPLANKSATLFMLGLVLTLVVRAAVMVLRSKPLVSIWSSLPLPWLVNRAPSWMPSPYIEVVFDIVAAMALFTIGKRWINAATGFGLAWAVLAMSLGGGSIATVFIVMAVLAMQKSAMAGSMLGVASVFYWPLTFAIPGWAAFYASDSRKSFLIGTVAAVFVSSIGVITVLALNGQFIDPSASGMSMGRPIMAGLLLVGLAVGLTVFPKTKSRVSVTLSLAAIGLAAVMLWPTPLTMSAALPWLAVTMFATRATSLATSPQVAATAPAANSTSPPATPPQLPSVAASPARQPTSKPPSIPALPANAGVPTATVNPKPTSTPVQSAAKTSALPPKLPTGNAPATGQQKPPRPTFAKSPSVPKATTSPTAAPQTAARKPLPPPKSPPRNPDMPKPPPPPARG